MAVVAFPHPFAGFIREQAALKFITIFVLAVACLAAILALDNKVKTPVASGYGALEFAASVTEAKKVGALSCVSVIVLKLGRVFMP